MSAKGILGRKVGMSQIFTETGECVPVTVIEAGPCHVLQLRTPEKDGYSAVQIGFRDKPRRLATRSERGHVSAELKSKRSAKQAGGEASPKANCEPKRFIRELRVPTDGYAVGQEIKVDQFADVKAVDVIGTSKGRGYAGAMKRHNFKGLRATHGVKKVHRSLGGTGALASNRGGGRMKKGKKMPGQYGSERVTTRNLKVVKVDSEKNLLLLRGAIPGPNGGYVFVRTTNKY